jgi:hypothetical protein
MDGAAKPALSLKGACYACTTSQRERTTRSSHCSLMASKQRKATTAASTPQDTTYVAMISKPRCGRESTDWCSQPCYISEMGMSCMHGFACETYRMEQPVLFGGLQAFNCCNCSIGPFHSRDHPRSRNVKTPMGIWRVFVDVEQCLAQLHGHVQILSARR